MEFKLFHLQIQKRVYWNFCDQKHFTLKCTLSAENSRAARCGTARFSGCKKAPFLLPWSVENYFRYKCKIGNNAINSTDGKITLHYMCHVKMLSVWETLPMLVLHALSCHECVICAILCALLQGNAWII